MTGLLAAAHMTRARGWRFVRGSSRTPGLGSGSLATFVGLSSMPIGSGLVGSSRPSGSSQRL
jgi:hypothetical protein